MTNFDPKRIIKKIQDKNTLNDKDFFEISEYLSNMPWHCQEPIDMMQRIISDHPNYISEILKINKTNSTPQHYITMAMITPYILPEMPKNLPFDTYSLPNKNIKVVCKAVKNSQGWYVDVIDRVIDLINRYDVPIRSTFVLLDSIYDSSINVKHVMMICGWMYQNSKVITDDVSFIIHKWYNAFDIKPWLNNSEYQIDVNNRYIKFDKDKNMIVLERDMSRIRNVALFLISQKK